MKKEKKITIRVSEEEYERIEKVAKKLKLPESKVIRNLTMIGLEYPELFNKLELFEISILIEEITDELLDVKDFTNINVSQNEPTHEERP